MFILKQNYLKRELHAGKIVNKRHSFLFHTLVSPCLSCWGLRVWKLCCLDSGSFINVKSWLEVWELKPCSFCGNPNMSSRTNGVSQCPVITAENERDMYLWDFSLWGVFLLYFKLLSVVTQPAKGHFSLTGWGAHPRFFISSYKKTPIYVIPETFMWLMF